MKKASADMWWIIVGAVMALIVLFVVMLIFTTRTGKLEVGLGDCPSKGGKCLSTNNCVSPAVPSEAFECRNEEVCCFGWEKLSGA